jgi:hypothetical protein
MIFTCTLIAPYYIFSLKKVFKKGTGKHTASEEQYKKLKFGMIKHELA